MVVNNIDRIDDRINKFNLDAFHVYDRIIVDRILLDVPNFR